MSKLKRPVRPDLADSKHAALVDDLREFEEFRETTLPVLRELVRKKAPPAEILEAVKSLAAARLGTMLITADAKTALTAIKDILDRTEGKARESVTHTHQLENIPEQQFDALLNTEIENLKKAKAKASKQEH